MQRRRYLALAGVSMTALAGCSEEEGGGDNGSDGTETAEMETLTETAEPTATATTEPPADETTMAETEAETEPETETETPTSTETETETEVMMETETPTVTSTATPATQGGFSETYSGNGQSTVEGLELTPGPITAEVTVGSEAYHTFELITLEGESFEDVQLASGVFSGEGRQVAAVLAEGEHNLNVDTEAEWEITIEQPTNPDPASLPIDESGSGYDYAGPFAFDGPTTFQGTHEGESNFIVSAVSLDPSGLGTIVFNETEQFDGETTERVDGPAYLNVEADGEWTVSTG
jgi:hypothetical protein